MFLLVAEDTIAQVTFFRLPESGQSAENVVIYYLLTIIGCFTICLLSPECWEWGYVSRGNYEWGFSSKNSLKNFQIAKLHFTWLSVCLFVCWSPCLECLINHSERKFDKTYNILLKAHDTHYPLTLAWHKYTNTKIHTYTNICALRTGWLDSGGQIGICVFDTGPCSFFSLTWYVMWWPT